MKKSIIVFMTSIFLYAPISHGQENEIDASTKYRIQQEINGKTCQEFKRDLIGILSNNPSFPELEGAEYGTPLYVQSQYSIKLMIQKSVECM